MSDFNPLGLSWEQRCARGRVLLVDDDPHVLAGLGGLLSLDGYACQSFCTVRQASEALAAVMATSGPRCMLCDVRMPEQGGLEMQRSLEAVRTVPMILMSGAAGPGDVVRAFRGGAVDFLLKPIEAEALIGAVNRALTLSLERQQADDNRARDRARLATLTPRERQVTWRVARGELNREIAQSLGISERTVKHHRAVAMEKLGIQAVVDLARLVDRSQVD